MNRSANGRAGLLEDVITEVVNGLRNRRTEIEEAIFAHVRDATSFGTAGGEDAEWVTGLRATVTAAMDYVLVGIEQGHEWSGPIPSMAVAQAHRAARNGVGLETVLLRYAAGSRLLVRFAMAEAADFPIDALQQVLDMQGLLAERLMAGVSVEYKQEVERMGRSPEKRRAERVRRLLAGEAVDSAELGYELDAWHVCVIATGAGARDAVRALAEGVDRQLLAVSHGEETVWAWLGGQRKLAFADIEHLLLATASISQAVVGEPGKGVNGLRLTHRQAQAALLVALRSRERLTRYADVALLAAALRDDVLARWLLETFLSPLDSQRDRGAALRETLRVYFATGRNVSKAAVALSVKRQTVEQRMQTVDQALGRALDTCLAELEVALRLDELGPAREANATDERD